MHDRDKCLVISVYIFRLLSYFKFLINLKFYINFSNNDHPIVPKTFQKMSYSTRDTLINVFHDKSTKQIRSEASYISL